ncbi:nitrite extrusion protein 2 [Enterobacter hormaechei]|nr:nitrite extrusion protein 2 [Klebsiella pneumoniae]OUK74369.1 nitrite extrusion protein 2 [Enterobacter hormaechei]
MRFSGPKTSIIRTPTTSLKTSIKTITNLSDTNCLEIQGASLKLNDPVSTVLRSMMMTLSWWIL